MKINEYLRKHFSIIKYADGFEGKENAPRVECADGFNMSVQASEDHCCYPRKNIPFLITAGFHYAEVEVSYPSAYEAVLMPYAEDESFPLDTVYAYVPVEVVDAIIAKHGGLVEED